MTQRRGETVPQAVPRAVPHGGDLDAARRLFPGAPEPWLDLSTGMNPYAYPLPQIDGEAWARLPQRHEFLALADAAARRYRAAAPAMVAPAPGTQALIGLLPGLVSPSRVAVLGPTYGEHAAAWRRAGHDVFEVSDLKDAADARILVVVNPNNPTGRIVPPAELRRAAQVLDARVGFLIVDEAFADVMPRQASLVPDMPPAAIVLRSFGKAYGLAGLRLGFAIAPAETAQRLRDRLGPWPVSGPAIAIGTAALADDRWLENTLQRLERGCERLDALLADAGCTLLGGTPLFRLVAHGSASRLAATLGARGVLVRAFAQQPTWLRFGLPGPEAAWQRLADALRAAHHVNAGDTAAL
jgi:cobalamin biosynthesis protein CobC